MHRHRQYMPIIAYGGGIASWGSSGTCMIVSGIKKNGGIVVAVNAHAQCIFSACLCVGGGMVVWAHGCVDVCTVCVCM